MINKILLLTILSLSVTNIHADDRDKDRARNIDQKVDRQRADDQKPGQRPADAEKQMQRIDADQQRVDSRRDEVRQRIDNRRDDVQQRVQRRDEDRKDMRDRMQDRDEGRKDLRESVQRKVDNRQRDVQQRIERRDNDRLKNRQPLSKERITRDNTQWSRKGNEVRSNFRNYRDRDHVFDRHYWDNYYRYHNRWNFRNNMNWWVVTNWNDINLWFPGRWQRPIYYYYIDDGIYYSQTGSDYDLVPLEETDYLQSALDIIGNMPKVDPSKLDWKPLGVFSLVNDETDDTPDDFFTLAVSKEGIVGGAYVNPEEDNDQAVEGYVDPQSQQVVWRVVGTNLPLYETGIYNLTKDESTVLILYSNRDIETGALIRLKE